MKMKPEAIGDLVFILLIMHPEPCRTGFKPLLGPDKQQSNLFFGKRNLRVANFQHQFF